MEKKKTRKSGAAKAVRDLPGKTLNSKSAKGVRGGDKAATGSGEGKATFHDFSFTHKIDKAST
jgi:hypothetical protein